MKRLRLLPRRILHWLGSVRGKFIALTLSTAAGLLIAEGVVRSYSPDWPLLSGLLYYQKADLPAHKPDPDPRILYRLRPGFWGTGRKIDDTKITVNSHGARGPDVGARPFPGYAPAWTLRERRRPVRDHAQSEG